jgi:hypothetical protein
VAASIGLSPWGVYRSDGDEPFVQAQVCGCAGGSGRAFDTDVVAGHRYTYYVVAMSQDRTSFSRPTSVTVDVPPVRQSNPPISTTSPTSTTIVGRVVTAPISFFGGQIRLDPSDGATPSVTAAQALSTSRVSALYRGQPTLLLGWLTGLTDFAPGGVPVINHRLAWLAVFHDYPLTPSGSGVVTRAVAVDAQTGKWLEEWEWSGEN